MVLSGAAVDPTIFSAVRIEKGIKSLRHLPTKPVRYREPPTLLPKCDLGRLNSLGQTGLGGATVQVIGFRRLMLWRLGASVLFDDRSHGANVLGPRGPATSDDPGSHPLGGIYSVGGIEITQGKQNWRKE